MSEVWLGFDTESDVTQWSYQPGLPISPKVLDESLAAVSRLSSILHAHQTSATFFLVGRLLEVAGSQYVSLLAHDKHDIECHTYSHHIFHERHLADPIDEAQINIRKGLDLLEQHFGKRPQGLCVPGGAIGGMRKQRERLQVLWKEGIRFLKSDNLGQDSEMPVPYTSPYTYAEDGFPELWELPGSGWHCTYLLQPFGPSGTVPGPVVPHGQVLDHLPVNIEEQIAFVRQELDYTREHNTHYSPSWHPWCLYRFDPELTIVEFLIDYAQQHQMPVMTYCQVYEELLSKAAQPQTIT